MNKPVDSAHIEAPPKHRSGLTAAIAHQLAATRGDDIGADALRATKEHVLYTIGTVLAGRQSPGIAQMLAGVQAFGTTPESSVLGHGLRLPAHAAALANATMAHSRELDINDDRIAYKSSTAAVPAALAVAEKLRPLSGRAFLDAVCVGVDFGIRLGLATRPQPTHGRFSALGPFASGVAVGRLMGFDAARMHDLLGIAYSRSTLAANSRVSPSLGKRLAAGFAAQSGVIAATIAAAGFPASGEVFAGKMGFFQTFFGEEGDHDTLLDSFGRRFEIVSVGPKPFPSCRYTHPAVVASLTLRERHGFSAGEIEEVHVYVGERDMRVVCGVDEQERRKRCSPEGVVDAQFSIPYTVAASLLRGGLTLREFDDDAIGASDVVDLARRVRPVHEPLFDEWPWDVKPQMVEVALRDGRRFRERVDYPKGSANNPFTTEEVSDAFRTMVSFGAPELGADAVETVIARVRDLENVDDVGVIADLLRGARPSKQR